MSNEELTSTNQLLQTEDYQSQLRELTEAGHGVAMVLLEAAFPSPKSIPEELPPLYVEQALELQRRPELRETLAELLGRL